MAEELRHTLTIFDAMVLVAAAAVGAWDAAAYRAFPLPITARPGLPMLPLMPSVPVVRVVEIFDAPLIEIIDGMCPI
jgi:hypothetical protein